MQSKVYIRPHDLDLQLRTLQLKKEKSLSEIVDLLPQELLFSTEKEKEKKKQQQKTLKILNKMLLLSWAVWAS